MAWIKVINEDEATGYLAELYEKLKAPYGKVPNVTKVTSLRPEAMDALAQLRRAIRSPGAALSTRRQEMIAAVVSASVSCTY